MSSDLRLPSNSQSAFAIYKLAISLAVVLILAGTAAVVVAVAFSGQRTAEWLDRWIIIGLAVWIAYRAIPTATGVPARPNRWGLLPMVLAVPLLPPVWYLIARVGARPSLVGAVTLGWLGGIGGAFAVSGRVRLRPLLLPALLLLFAIPIPQPIQRPVQTRLQWVVTSAVARGLPVLGVPTQRSGFVLSLPSGDLGVVEACSGYKSIMALSAIALLIAYVRGFGLGRGAVLLILSLPATVACNIGRVIVSGLLQEYVSRWATLGIYHDILGYLALLVGLGFLLLMAKVIGRRSISTELSIQDLVLMPAGRLPTWSTVVPAVFLMLMVGGSVATFALGRRDVEVRVVAAPLEQMPTVIGDWTATELNIAPGIQQSLGCDRAIHRAYRNRLGQEVEAWIIFWEQPGTARGYHHPDICMPSRGWTVVRSAGDTLKLVDGTTIPVTMRQFERDANRQFIFYWSQEGNRIWTDTDEAIARQDGLAWLRDSFLGSSVERSGRLMVLVGGDVWGESGYAEKSIREFAGAVATELYRTLPWAHPQGS